MQLEYVPGGWRIQKLVGSLWCRGMAWKRALKSNSWTFLNPKIIRGQNGRKIWNHYVWLLTTLKYLLQAIKGTFIRGPTSPVNTWSKPIPIVLNLLIIG